MAYKVMDFLAHHTFEDRPWGNFEEFTLNEPTTIKIITVNPGEAFSLQRHHNRDEVWKVISGNGHITINESREEIVVGKIYSVPRGTLHRIESSTAPVVFLEIAFGAFDENDIERIEDKYGRT